jgi:hypothetical protein
MTCSTRPETVSRFFVVTASRSWVCGCDAAHDRSHGRPLALVADRAVGEGAHLGDLVADLNVDLILDGHPYAPVAQEMLRANTHQA